MMRALLDVESRLLLQVNMGLVMSITHLNFVMCGRIARASYFELNFHGVYTPVTGLMFFMGFPAFIVLPLMFFFFFLRSLTSFCAHKLVLTHFLMFFGIGFRWIFPWQKSSWLCDLYAFQAFALSSVDGDRLRDMHWFMVCQSSAMYDESFSVHQALKDHGLLHELRIPFQLWENSLEEEKGFQYSD